MSDNPNQPRLIQTPKSAHLRVVISIDPNTQQSEMKIENGRMTNLQLQTLLMEHATNIARQLMITEARLTNNPAIIKPNGGNNGAA